MFQQDDFSSVDYSQFLYTVDVFETALKKHFDLDNKNSIYSKYIDKMAKAETEITAVSGVIVYVLSILAVAMACILYFANTGMAGLATEFFNLFISVSLISLITTGFLIGTWAVGENRVEHTTTEIELGK